MAQNQTSRGHDETDARRRLFKVNPAQEKTRSQPFFGTDSEFGCLNNFFGKTGARTLSNLPVGHQKTTKNEGVSCRKMTLGQTFCMINFYDIPKTDDSTRARKI